MSRESSGALEIGSQKNFASRSRAVDHSLGVLRDQAFVLWLRVDDGEERFLEFPAPVTTGK